MKTKIIILAAMFSLTSCMTTKTNVGEYKQQTGKECVYSKGKQVWLLWGIFPVGRTHVETPTDGNCQVVTRFTFVDMLIQGLTAGIVTTETIKVKVKKQNSVVNK